MNNNQKNLDIYLKDAGVISIKSSTEQLKAFASFTIVSAFAAFIFF